MCRSNWNRLLSIDSITQDVSATYVGLRLLYNCYTTDEGLRGRNVLRYWIYATSCAQKSVRLQIIPPYPPFFLSLYVLVKTSRRNMADYKHNPQGSRATKGAVLINQPYLTDLSLPFWQLILQHCKLEIN